MSQPEQLTLDRLWRCPECDGEGETLAADPESNSRILSIFPCRTCQGTGQVGYDPKDPDFPY